MKPAILTLLLMLLAACHSIQTTSGADYVSARGPSGRIDIDAEIAKAARVEPNLRFPARIGLARVVNGRLSTPSPGEMEVLAGLAERNRHIGTFVPVSPVIAAMVRPAITDTAPRNLVNDIRLGAARQHLDHVLIYEIGVSGRRGATPFGLADITLIGAAILPTRKLEAEGKGQALLVDVRNGYPYGTAQTSIDLSGLSVTIGAERRQRALQDEAATEVIVKLTEEVEAMLTDLYRTLR